MSATTTPHWLVGDESDPVTAIRKGLPFEALRVLKRHLKLSDAMLGRLLAISPRTLRRRARQDSRLSREESDRLWMVAQTYELAINVFEDEHRARTWLTNSHRMLNDESPLEHMDTAAGIERVCYVLHQIQYSMPV